MSEIPVAVEKLCAWNDLVPGVWAVPGRQVPRNMDSLDEKSLNVYGDVVIQQESEALAQISALTFGKQHTLAHTLN